MKPKQQILWLNLPENHNYPAALSYLSLIYDEKLAIKYVEDLKLSPIQYFKSKDIFRASSLPMLSKNSHVEKNLKKIESNIQLSPLLLVRNHQINKLIIADGYHRLCAVYSFDEDALIPVKIV